MIRLGLRKEPYWLDLPGGVRLQVRPLTTAVMAAAEAHAERLIRRLAQDRRDRIEAGLPFDGLPDLDNDDVRMGLARALLARTLGVQGTIAWEGVVHPPDREGGEPEPAELCDATVAQLMEIPVVARAFLARYTAPIDALISEGNASSAAPAGTGAAAPDTAHSAGSTTAPAPAASPAPAVSSAPTSSTPPAPSRASRSGTS